MDRPRPTRNIPILIGGGGERKTLRIAAQYADITHFYADVPTYAHKMQVLNDWCAEIGRNPDEIERACGTGMFASSKMRDDYVKAGATHFIIGMSGIWDDSAVEDLVRWRDSRNAG